MQPEPEIGSRWRHWKGNLYEVTMKGRFADGACERVIMYRRVEDGQLAGTTWTRLFSEWHEITEGNVPRFTPEVTDGGA